MLHVGGTRLEAAALKITYKAPLLGRASIRAIDEHGQTICQWKIGIAQCGLMVKITSDEPLPPLVEALVREALPTGRGWPWPKPKKEAQQ